MKELLFRSVSKPLFKGISLILFVVMIMGVGTAFSSTVKWKKILSGGGGYSTTLGTNGTIYVTSRNVANGDTVLHAFDQSGTQQWQLPTSWQVIGTPAIGPDGTIYIGSQAQKLYAFNPNSSLKWQYSTGYNTKTPAIGSDGTIYVASGHWNYNNGVGAFHAIDSDTGLEKWTYSIANISGVYTSPSIGPDGTIYVGIKISGDTTRLYAFNPDGTLKWISQGNGYSEITQPAINSDGTIYIASNLGLRSIDPDDGSLNWTYPTGGIYLGSPAIGSDGTIYIGSTDDKLYAIYSNGTLKWSYTTGGDVSSTPSIGSDGTVYAVSRDHNLYAIHPYGTLRWVCDIDNDSLSSPAIGSDNTIYVSQHSSVSTYLVAVNGDGTTLATNTPWPTLGRNSQHTANIREFIPEPISPVAHQTVQTAAVNFTWNEVNGASTYIFQVANNPGFVSPTSQEISATSISVSNTFTSGLQYFWRIAVKSDFVDPVFSEIETFIYQGPLSHPLIFAPDFGEIIASPVPMSWGFPGATIYGLQIATDPGFSQLVFSNYVGFSSANFTCAPSTTYYWRVLPFDSNYNLLGSWSHIYTFTTSAP